MKKLDAYRIYLVQDGAISFFLSMIFVASMVYQVERVGLSPLQLVLVGTTLEATIFLFEIPTGVVADVYSRRLSIIIGVFLIGLGFLLEGSIAMFWAVALGQALWGLGYTFTSGATQAWISDEIGEEAAGKAFLRASQVSNISGLAGTGAGMLLSNIQVNTPILAGGRLLLLLGVFLILFMPEHGFHPLPRQERNSWQNMAYTFRGGLGMLQRRPLLVTILLIGFFYGLYSEGFDRLWVKHMLDHFSLPGLPGFTPVVWVGLIGFGSALLSAAAAGIVRKRLDMNNPRQVVGALFALALTLIASLILFAQIGDWFVGMLAALWGISVARGVTGPIYTAWVNQRLDSRVRATVISMSSQVDAIGQIVGGPGMGVVGNLVSVRAAITLSGILLSPVLGMYAYAARKVKASPEETPGSGNLTP